MKTALIFLFSVLASCATAYDDVQVTYRGRVTDNGEDPGEQTVSMTFRLYEGKGDDTASWSATKDVIVGSSGMFQVALSGNGLADVIDAGKAKWIGVSVEGGKEHYPRQELLAAPFAERAGFAGRLGDSPSVVTAKVGTVTAKELVVNDLSVAGEISVVASSAPVKMSVNMTKAWSTLSIKGDVGFFSGASPRGMGTGTATGGGCEFGTADCNCAALFCSVNSDIMPGMTLFFRKNEKVAVPNTAKLPDGTAVKCFVYPIGVE